MRIRAVFFDFQDTLARFREGPWNSSYGLYLEAAQEQGIEVDPESLYLPSDEAWADFQTPEGPDHARYSADEDLFQQVRVNVHGKRLAKAGITGATAEAIARRVDELEAESERYELFDDVMPTLDALARFGVQSVIVSNHVWRLHEIVRDLGLGAKIEGVVNSAHVGYRKPHPAIYRAALQLSGIPAEETVMVGDSISHDVTGAEAAGIHGVLLDRTGDADAPDGATVIHSLTETPLQWPP